MVLRKITIVNSVRYVPKSEQTKKRIVDQKQKSWFTSRKTKQKTVTTKKIP